MNKVEQNALDKALHILFKSEQHETPGFQEQEDEGDVTDFDEDNEDEDVKKGGPGSGRKGGGYVYDQNHKHNVGDRVRSAAVNGANAGKEGKVTHSMPGKKGSSSKVHVQHDDGSSQWYSHQDLERQDVEKAMSTDSTEVGEHVEKSLSYIPDGSQIHRRIAGNIYKSYSNANELSKGGPGSGRKGGSTGGSKIGTTTSGKHIYADKPADHKDHKDWTAEDHEDASIVHGANKDFKTANHHHELSQKKASEEFSKLWTGANAKKNK